MFYIKAIINNASGIDSKGINMYENLDIVAQEIINLAHKKQFYKNGLLVDEIPKMSYPIYDINKVEHMIYPIEAIVWFNPKLFSKLEILKNKLNNLTYIFNKDVYDKFPNLAVKCPVGCTTNFTSVNLVTNSKMLITYSDKSVIRNQTNNIFNYIIRFENKYINDIKLNQHNSNPELRSKSLYSIIYDTHDIYSIEDKTLSPEYPKISQLNIVINKRLLCDQVNYSVYYGLTTEIAKYYVEKSKFNLFSSIPPEYKIQWAKWEDLSVYESNKLDPVYQINSGILDGDFPKVELKKTNKIHKCFMTGVPIYDDCYVFDIYARYEIKVIPENKVSKYKDWEVVEEFNPKDINHVIQWFKKGKILFTKGDIIISNYYGLLIMKNKETYEILSKKELYCDRDFIYTLKYVHHLNTIKKINYDFYQDNDKFIHYKKSRYIDIDYSDIEFYVQSDGYYNDCQFNKIIKKYNTPIINDKQVMVRKLIKYDKPRCILISSWFVHFYGMSQHLTNSIYKFEELTNSKFIIYRTKAPTSIDKVIDILPTSDCYKKLYRSLNKKIISAGEIVNCDAYPTACLSTDEYVLYDNFASSMIESDKILAIMKLPKL